MSKVECRVADPVTHAKNNLKIHDPSCLPLAVHKLFFLSTSWGSMANVYEGSMLSLSRDNCMCPGCYRSAALIVPEISSKRRFAGFVLSRRSKKVTDKDTNATHIRRTKK